MKVTITRIFFTLALALFLGSSAIAIADQQVRWETLVGVIQPGNVVGSGTGAVAGAGQPWITTDGTAQVNLTSGRIRFTVEGLVFAGGNSIGTVGTNTQVRGTLVCDTNGSVNGNSTLVNTPLVPLSAQGDAEFSGSVAIPAACINEPDIAFLVRSAAGAWFAAGVVRVP